MLVSADDPRDLLDLALRAAHEAGRLLSDKPTHPLHTAAKSSPTDLVTEMDHASEKLITEVILSERPKDGVIGEEGSSRKSQSGLSWMIDPIDGTINYLRGLPNYTISIAAINENKVVTGVVYDPTLDETFTAIRDHGAVLNNLPIACSTTPLAEAVIGTGFSYSSAQRAAQAEVLRAVLPAIADIRRPGSAAVSLCWVACGRLDAFFETGLQPWDFAAGALIALEAGADVQGVKMHLPHSEMVIASAPTITDRLTQILNPYTELT
jgi:myo-inositol-1(or 4)-monophosphatase